MSMWIVLSYHIKWKLKEGSVEKQVEFIWGVAIASRIHLKIKAPLGIFHYLVWQ